MNKLFYGDNLEVLRKYIKDETIDLCYIDPPFHSNRNYHQIYNNISKKNKGEQPIALTAFLDTWIWDDHANIGLTEIQENYLGHFTTQAIDLINGLTKVLSKGSLLAYLVNMTLRIAEIYRVLKPTGSFYLHCDPSASHYLKLVLDTFFCSQKGDFLNEIIWKRTTTHNDSKQGSKHFGRIHDLILFYIKDKKQVKFNPIYETYSDSYTKKNYHKIDDTGRHFKTSDLSCAKAGGNTSYLWKGISPPEGRYWAYSLENMEKFERENKIYYSRNGKPYLKQYLDEMSGITPNDLWLDFPGITNKNERLGYPTQKPEALLERIINASSNENDLILDAFSGSGTTLKVAQKLNRKWIGIDLNFQSISLILKRLEDSFGKEILDLIEVKSL